MNPTKKFTFADQETGSIFCTAYQYDEYPSPNIGQTEFASLNIALKLTNVDIFALVLNKNQIDHPTHNHPESALGGAHIQTNKTAAPSLLVFV